MVNVGILGASGYTGLELIRILLNHPHVKISVVTSEKYSGNKISDVFPFFKGHLDLKYESLSPEEVLKKCDFVYLGNYTSKLNTAIGYLEKLYGKKIIPAGRELVEIDAQKSILQQAKSKNVAFLVAGDVFAATTHIDMFLRAKKLGIDIKIVHNASVLTAIGITGLQLYKFGKTASIAKWQHNFNPESFYDSIKQNLSAGSHTLLLLDIGLPVKEALGYIESIAKARDLEMLERDIVVCEKLGTEKQKISIGKIFEG